MTLDGNESTSLAVKGASQVTKYEIFGTLLGI